MLYSSLSTILSFHHGAVLVAGQRDKNKISYYKHYIIMILFLVAGQRDQLKGAHKKMLDVMNMLGISNSLIKARVLIDYCY